MMTPHFPRNELSTRTSLRKHCYPGILDDFSKLFYLHVDICRICFRTLPGASGNRTAETLL
jgi:hypothetical protein